MDDDYLRERARVIREIAETADPFTRGRLLALASKYDARLMQRKSVVPRRDVTWATASVKPISPTGVDAERERSPDDGFDLDP